MPLVTLSRRSHERFELPLENNQNKSFTLSSKALLNLDESVAWDDEALDLLEQVDSVRIVGVSTGKWDLRS